MGEAAAAIAIMSTVAGGAAKEQGISAGKQGVVNQMTMQKIAESNRNTQRLQHLQKIVGADAVGAAAKGVELASPSFTAITQNNIDSYEQDKQADALNTSWKESALQARMDALDVSQYANVFGTITSMATEYQKL